MSIYVVRHGQTDWNKQGKMQGCTDIELNETGIQQAYEAKQRLKECSIDIAIVSPLKRAVKTAQIMLEDRKIPIIYEDRIKEICFGELEGQTIEKFDYKGFWNIENPVQYKGAENVAEVIKRVQKAFDEIKQKYKDKNVLIVAHGGVARAIKVYFDGMPEDKDLTKIKMENCEIVTYEFGK